MSQQHAQQQAPRRFDERWRLSRAGIVNVWFYLDNEFDLSTDDRFGGLLWTKEKLARPNEHYLAIHPTEAAEVEARRAEERAQAEAKKQQPTVTK